MGENVRAREREKETRPLYNSLIVSGHFTYMYITGTLHGISPNKEASGKSIRHLSAEHHQDQERTRQGCRARSAENGKASFREWRTAQLVSTAGIQVLSLSLSLFLSAFASPSERNDAIRIREHRRPDKGAVAYPRQVAVSCVGADLRPAPDTASARTLFARGCVQSASSREWGKLCLAPARWLFAEAALRGDSGVRAYPLFPSTNKRTPGRSVRAPIGT